MTLSDQRFVRVRLHILTSTQPNYLDLCSLSPLHYAEYLRMEAELTHMFCSLALPRDGLRSQLGMFVLG